MALSPSPAHLGTAGVAPGGSGAEWGKAAASSLLTPTATWERAMRDGSILLPRRALEHSKC